jgi:hypothetical protein
MLLSGRFVNGCIDLIKKGPVVYVMLHDLANRQNSSLSRSKNLNSVSAKELRNKRLFAVLAVEIYSTYYKRNLVLNILLAGPISCFIVLAFHAFSLARNTLNLTLKHKKLLKKVLPEAVKHLKGRFPAKDIQLWFQDEARIGQQGTVCRMWADTGSCPRAIRQTNYKWTYLFGSVCPVTGQCHGWRMPYANTWIMNLYLNDFAKQLPENVHALMIMDGAG